jgi:hypothetical protein
MALPAGLAAIDALEASLTPSQHSGKRTAAVTDATLVAAVTRDIERPAMVACGPADRADVDFEHLFHDLGGGDLKALQTKWHVYTIEQGGSPFFDGFVTEEAREALRFSGGFPPSFSKKAILSHPRKSQWDERDLSSRTLPAVPASKHVADTTSSLWAILK